MAIAQVLTHLGDLGRSRFERPGLRAQGHCNRELVGAGRP